MKITSLFSGLIVLVVSTGFSTISFKTQAATYFKCESGYSFQVSGQSARCFKAASKSYTTPLKCPNVTIPAINKSIGHFLDQDYQGNKDKCVGTFKIGPVTNSNVLDLSCRPGYSLETRRGKDRCYKNISAKALAPVKRIQR